MNKDKTDKSKRENKSKKGKKQEKSYNGLSGFFNTQDGSKQGQSGGKNTTDSE